MACEGKQRGLRDLGGEVAIIKGKSSGFPVPEVNSQLIPWAVCLLCLSCW